MRSPGWLTADTPRSRRLVIPLLGQRARTAKGRERPLDAEERAAQARLARHGACAEHRPIGRLREPVCILKGQAPDVVLADAEALA